ncbi:MAG: hypothetical protein Fur0032_15780 [Terrimicrobiaceae bacterium]
MTSPALNRENFIAALGAGLARVLFLTIRTKLHDPTGALPSLVGQPMIVCFWHNRILGVAHAFLNGYPQGRGGVTVLTSPSRDGEILAGVMRRLGMGAVRGSSSRRGARAMRELIDVIQSGGDVAITPDGPRGPRYCLGPGVIALASSTGTPILPVHATFSRAHRMKTWDGFIIPLPGSHVCVTVDQPWQVPPGLDDIEFESWRLRLENHLKNAAD